mgnify:CR=1 FL=1|tara:strand:- start:928 stop:1236 length:309 start_codon:yes stop_codon:yes gene_type:complete
MSHPKGYTQEMIKEILGTAWLDKDNIAESGNEMRKRKGREMREGKRPYPTYPSKESRIADTSGKFDESGAYIYPSDSGFNYVQWCKDHPDSTEAGSYGNKVS